MRPNTAVHAGDHFVEHQPVAPDQLVDGHPHTGLATLGRFGGLEVGVWEMTPGVMRDVEADEVFVVIAGAARVEFTDGTAPLTLKPGDVVRLGEGAETVWIDSVAVAHIVDTGLKLLEHSPIISRRVDAGSCGIVCVTIDSVDGRLQTHATVGALGESPEALLECV